MSSGAPQPIIVSDTVNLLAAVVLYFLAVGGVQGFAFTLGVTTVVDLAVIILFTHRSAAVSLVPPRLMTVWPSSARGWRPCRSAP